MEQKPDFQKGVDYWHNTEATVNGVLGGYGQSTPVPRLDAAASRALILSILPTLSTITPPHRPKPTTPPPCRSFRALDCGAGIGRVTSTVLLPLFDRIDLVEPVEKFVMEAKKSAEKGNVDGWKLLKPKKEDPKSKVPEKGVRMWLSGLQFFDPLTPAIPLNGGSIRLVATAGSDKLVWPDPKTGTTDDLEDGYDLIMVQWCIGHLSDEELVEYLKRCHKALRRTSETGLEGYIILKENTCKDEEDSGKGVLFDDSDSSVTRSDKVFRRIFKEAGLNLLRREIQMGFPKELFPVIAYVLR